MVLELKVKDEFRVISNSVASAPWQMAVDHAMLEIMERKLEDGLVVKPVVRTYQFDNSAVILGCNQNGDKIRANLNGRYFTTRVTGGGHMYFTPDDVHFSVTLPKNFVSEDMIDSFRAINYKVMCALRELGYNARLGRTSIKIDLDEEKTLVGSAQRRKKYAMLQHGTIIINDYNSEIFDLLNASEEERKVWQDKIVTLSMLRGKVDSGSLARAVLEKFSERDFVDSEIDIEELKLARKLYNEIYNNATVIGNGQRHKNYICLLEGLITNDYSSHLREHAGEK